MWSFIDYHICSFSVEVKCLLCARFQREYMIYHCLIDSWPERECWRRANFESVRTDRRSRHVDSPSNRCAICLPVSYRCWYICSSALL
jgi:hypothetical protein